MELNELITALEGFMKETQEKLDLLAQVAHKNYTDNAELQTVVYDRIIGDADKMWKDGLRQDGIAGVKSKYGEKFSPFHDDYNKLLQADPEGIYEHLFDDLEEAKGGEGFNEEGHIGSILEQFKTRFGDKSPAAAVSVETKSVEPTAEKSEGPMEEDPLDNIKKIAQSRKPGSPLVVEPE
jgi:hypothetical protein